MIEFWKTRLLARRHTATFLKYNSNFGTYLWLYSSHLWQRITCTWLCEHWYNPAHLENLLKSLFVGLWREFKFYFFILFLHSWIHLLSPGLSLSTVTGKIFVKLLCGRDHFSHLLSLTQKNVSFSYLFSLARKLPNLCSEV